MKICEADIIAPPSRLRVRMTWLRMHDEYVTVTGAGSFHSILPIKYTIDQNYNDPQKTYKF